MTESDDTPHAEPAPHSTDRLYHVLSNTQRRLVLAYLAAADDPVDLTDLAAAIATHLGDAEVERHAETDTVMVELHHWHLPKLEDVGVLSYDPEQRTVHVLEHSIWSSVRELPGFDVF